MQPHFNSDFFEANRQRLRKLVSDSGPIIITANGLLQRGADSSYSFFQDASFWYLTGIDEPDITLVMDCDKEYLIVPTRDAVRQAFDGAVDFNELSQRSGIMTVHASQDGWDLIKNCLSRVKQVATIAAAPSYIEQYGLYTNPARKSLIDRLKLTKPNIKVHDISATLSHMRMIKQPAEILALQAAIDITIASLRAAVRPSKLNKYVYAYELEAEITRGFRARGASGHAFEPIVASGKLACTMHNIANNGSLDNDQLVVIDIGAEVEHYAADISRTLALGEPSQRQQAVHAAVLAVQEYAFSLLKPGTMLRHYEQAIEKFMGKKLRELGLIKIINHDNVRAYYPHATSHFLGLNVHDVGQYDRLLEPGSVITVEPGIYIAAEGIGIRIEDDVLITDSGIKILSDKLSRELT